MSKGEKKYKVLSKYNKIKITEMRYLLRYIVEYAAISHCAYSVIHAP